MAKYRKLALDELNELEKEFIDFLILNGISAEDWESILKMDPGSAEKTIELFSDVVFESVLRKIKFLEARTSGFLYVYQCLTDKIVVVGITSDQSEDMDFTNPDFINSCMLTPPEGLKVFTSEKAYAKNREEELFKMVQQGCVITDDRLFKALCLSLPLEK